MKTALLNRLAPLWGLLAAAGCSNSPPPGCTTNSDCTPPMICDTVEGTCIPPFTVDLAMPDQAMTPVDLAMAGDMATSADMAAPADMAPSDLAKADLTPPTDPFVWAADYGDTGQTDAAYAVTTDPSGNVILAGAFTGTVKIGTTTLTSNGGSDIFVAKFTSAGTVTWAESFGGTGTDQAYGVAVDGSNNIVITGTFQATAKFGSTTLTSVGGFDVMVAKLTPAGAVTWAKGFGGPMADAAASVAVDTAGNVDLTGYFTTAATFGTNILTSTNQGVFLAQLSSAGAVNWAKGFGGSTNDIGNRVAADSAGNVVMTGLYSGTINFGGGAAATTGQGDGFLAKFTQAGVFSWSKVLGAPNVGQGNGVATDSANNVVMTGSFQTSANFGNGKVSATGPTDIFVAKYGPTGTYAWAQHYGGAQAVEGGPVAIGADNSIVAAGTSNGSLSIGTLETIGEGAIAARFQADGTPEWARNYGSPGDVASLGVAVDPSENVYLAGDFSNQLLLNGTIFTAQGSTDIFVIKLSP